MAKLLINPSLGGNSDYYGTFAAFNNAFTGNVIAGLNVTQNGSPNMTVKVQPGQGLIREGSNPGQISYHSIIDTSGGESVTVSTANASNPRNDYIVGYVDKAATPSGTNNTNVYKLACVAGTPSATPADPTVPQIQSAVGASNPYDIYARIRVSAAATQVTTAMIDDIRSMTVSRNSAMMLGSATSTAVSVITGGNPAVLVVGKTVTIPAGGRDVEITGYIPSVSDGGASVGTVKLWDGTVGSGTVLQSNVQKWQGSDQHSVLIYAIVSAPAAGSKTYNMSIECTPANLQINGSATQPHTISVKVV